MSILGFYSCAVVALIVSACCSTTDVVQPPQNVCEAYKRIVPEIILEEELDRTRARLIDTAWTHVRTIFGTNKQYDSYEWTLFNHNHVHRDSQFAIAANALSGLMNIRFVGFSRQDSLCGASDGWDTVYRSVYYTSMYESEPAIFGTYEGTTTERPDSIVRVVIYGEETIKALYQAYLEGLPLGCDISILKAKGMFFGRWYSWKQHYFHRSRTPSYWEGNCKNMVAYCALDEDDENAITIEYTHVVPTPTNPYPHDSLRVTQFFRGRRVE